MDPHGDCQDSRSRRVKRLYDRLEALLGRLPPDRLEAFEEYIDNLERQEGPAGSDRTPPVDESSEPL